MRLTGAIALTTLLSAPALAACDRAPSDADAKVWTPSDHLEEKGRLPSGAQGPQTKGDAGDARTLIELTWRNQCASCHGAIGKGDGPNGPPLKATDLTKEEWQKGTSDAQIAQSIKNGKNRMPKFDLPDSVVQGLVARIRESKGR
jgi:cytochrome c oxidase cbb3-type subunit 3